MKNKINVSNLVAILIAILLFAIGIALWVISEQRVETAGLVDPGAHVARLSQSAVGAVNSGNSPDRLV